MKYMLLKNKQRNLINSPDLKTSWQFTIMSVYVGNRTSSVILYNSFLWCLGGMVTHFMMKLNISFPATGCQKLIEMDDEQKLPIFSEKRMDTEVAIDTLGED